MLAIKFFNVLFCTFLIESTAAQEKKLEEHKSMYNSINAYSKEITDVTKDLNPLTVFKTALMLHQRQPREVADISGRKGSSHAPPTIQPRLETGSSFQLKFDEQIATLKNVLPSVSEAKIAALLARENGDMDQVVQCLMNSHDSDDDEHQDTKVIDLTGSETPYSTEMKNLAKLNVDTNTLKTILATVEAKEANPAHNPDNLLSFHKPGEDITKKLGQMTDSSHSIELSNDPASNSCPYCQEEIDDQGDFCMFCGGVFSQKKRW